MSKGRAAREFVTHSLSSMRHKTKKKGMDVGILSFSDGSFF